MSGIDGPVEPPHLTASEVARRYAVSAQTVRAWMTTGIVVGSANGARRRVYLRRFKVGGRFRFTTPDVEAFLAEINGPPAGPVPMPESEAKRQVRVARAVAHAKALLNMP